MSERQDIRDKSVIDGFLIGVVFSVFVAIVVAWIRSQ